MSASDWVANTTATFFFRERLQPFADARREQWIVEKHPGFIEHQQRRPAIEASLEAMEQIGQHRQHQRLDLHQAVHLEVHDIAQRQRVRGAVQQPAVGAFQRVGVQRLAQLVGLHQHREAGQRALGRRRRCQALQRGPDGVLHIRRDGDLLVGEQPQHPIEREGECAGLVDVLERLKRQVAVERQIERRAVHGQYGRARGAVRHWITSVQGREPSSRTRPLTVSSSPDSGRRAAARK